MFLTQIHTKFKISVHNSTNSANIKTILNIRQGIIFLTQIRTNSIFLYTTQRRVQILKLY